MKKKIFIMLFAMLMIVSAMTAISFADGKTFDVLINGTQVTENNMNDILSDSGSVTYTPADDGNPAILTLNNATITNETESKTPITANGDLKIVLIGDNTITQKSSGFAICVTDGNLEITGEGNLTVNSTLYGIVTVNNSPDKSCSLTISAFGNVSVATNGSNFNNQAPALFSYDNIILSGSGDVTATSVYGPAIFSESNVIISGEGNVTASVTNNNGCEEGAICAEGDVKIGEYGPTGTVSLKNGLTKRSVITAGEGMDIIIGSSTSPATILNVEPEKDAPIEIEDTVVTNTGEYSGELIPSIPLYPITITFNTDTNDDFNGKWYTHSLVLDSTQLKDPFVFSWNRSVNNSDEISGILPEDIPDEFQNIISPFLSPDTLNIISPFLFTVEFDRETNLKTGTVDCLIFLLSTNGETNKVEGHYIATGKNTGILYFGVTDDLFVYLPLTIKNDGKLQVDLLQLETTSVNIDISFLLCKSNKPDNFDNTGWKLHHVDLGLGDDNPVNIEAGEDSVPPEFLKIAFNNGTATISDDIADKIGSDEITTIIPAVIQLMDSIILGDEEMPEITNSVDVPYIVTGTELEGDGSTVQGRMQLGNVLPFHATLEIVNEGKNKGLLKVDLSNLARLIALAAVYKGIIDWENIDSDTFISELDTLDLDSLMKVDTGLDTVGPGGLGTNSLQSKLNSLKSVLEAIDLGALRNDDTGLDTLVPGGSGTNSLQSKLENLKTELENIDLSSLDLSDLDLSKINLDNLKPDEELDGTGLDGTGLDGVVPGEVDPDTLLAFLEKVSLVIYLDPEEQCVAFNKFGAPKNNETITLKVGCETGEFTFEQVKGGYKIKDAKSGKYLANKNGILVYTNQYNADTWNYNRGGTLSVTEKINGYRVGFVYIPATYKTYYLSSFKSGAKLSLISAQLYESGNNGNHTWGEWTYKDNTTHVRKCTACGKVESAKHSVEADGHNCTICDERITNCVDKDTVDHLCDICGKYMPELCTDTDNNHLCDVCSTKLSDCVDANRDGKCDICGNELSIVNPVKVTVKTSKKVNVGMFFIKHTTYTAKINTSATGVTIRTVEYSLDGGRHYVNGNTVSSTLPITNFLIRVTDRNGKVYTFTYKNGIVIG